MANKITSGLQGINEIPEAGGPEWLRNPATIQPIEKYEDFIERSNTYFSECLDEDRRPTITGLALAAGLPGPTSLIRLGQRVPALRYAISRCMTAVAHQYEQLIAAGYPSSGAQFMLKNIPDFDPDEPDGSPGVQFFNDRKEVLLMAEVYGAATAGEDFDETIDPVDVYLSVIKKQGSASQALASKQTKALAASSPQSNRMRLFSIINPEGSE